MEREPLILVTGACRSGTTWTGHTLADAAGLHYVHEPLARQRCRCGLTIRRWFPYVTPEIAPAYVRHLGHSIGRDLLTELRTRPIRRWKDLRQLRDLMLAAGTGSGMVIKDPLAFFSTEWLQAEFGVRVVVLVRHPAAVAASYKRLGWEHSFADFLRQPRLMTDHLSSFAAEILDYAKRPPEIVEQAALLWRMIYSVAIRWQAQHPEWHFVRHEDLALHPVTGFEALIRRLELEYHSSAAQRIDEMTHAEPGSNDYAPYSIKRNSAAIPGEWKQVLTPSEIAAVRAATSEVWPAFYPESDW